MLRVYHIMGRFFAYATAGICNNTLQLQGMGLDAQSRPSCRECVYVTDLRTAPAELKDS